MTRKITLTIIALSTLFGAFTYSFNKAHSYSTGSLGNYTGSPGDNGVTCRSCHSPGTATPKTGLISTTIPATGYVPGVTYTITVSITESGRNKFGFEITAENAARQNRGSFINTTTQTRSVAGGVTHTAAGTAGSNGTKTWTFNWTAPAAGTGGITFYTAVNASNSNNSDSGDNIYTSSLSISEGSSSSITDPAYSMAFGVYPNPASETLYVPVEDVVAEVDIKVYDLQGRKVSGGIIPVIEQRARLDVSTLPAGVYMVSRGSVLSRFVKN